MILKQDITFQEGQEFIPKDVQPTKTQREIKQYTREDLVDLSRFLKDEWEGRVPEDVKHSTDSAPRWKVRNGWFTLIVGLIEQVELAQKEGTIEQFDATIQAAMTQFKKQVCHPAFIERLKTKEDINAGDAILNLILQKIAN